MQQKQNKSIARDNFSFSKMRTTSEKQTQFQLIGEKLTLTFGHSFEFWQIVLYTLAVKDQML